MPNPNFNSPPFGGNIGTPGSLRTAKRLRTSVPIQHPSYVAKLREGGIEVTKESVVAKIESLKQINPPEALKYFLELSELFRGTPDFDFYSNTLLEMAKHFRKTKEIKHVEYNQSTAVKHEGVTSDPSDQIHEDYDGHFNGYEQYYPPDFNVVPDGAEGTGDSGERDSHYEQVKEEAESAHVAHTEVSGEGEGAREGEVVLDTVREEEGQRETGGEGNEVPQNTDQQGDALK